jgi:HSP20 family molecular chaperone IbpA
MASIDTQELKVKEKHEATTPGELTRPGRVFTPVVDIYESDREITLLADMPGVLTDGINIDLRDNTLTLTGEIAPLEGAKEEDILIEYETGRYFRQFTLSEVIDQTKIDAQIKDGVLHLSLPKVAKATPRKIKVMAA